MLSSLDAMERRGRLGRPALDARHVPFQATAGSGKSARGAHQRHEVGQPSASLVDNFGRGGVKMSLPVRWIIVLVSVEI